VEAGVCFGFTAPGSEAEEVAKEGRGFALRPVKILDTASGIAISGCAGALSGTERRA